MYGHTLYLKISVFLLSLKRTKVTLEGDTFNMHVKCHEK
jgi:hypothetical protein